MSGRCAPTEALNILRPAFEPMEAADRLTQAVHRNMRLYCDGEIVPANFRKRLMVVAKPDPDGRWTADIVSAVGEAWDRPVDKEVSGKESTGIKFDGDLVFKEVVKPPYRWEFDIDEVKALLPPPPRQVRDGKPKPGSADAWIDHVCPNGEWRLMTAKDIHKKIVTEAEGLGVKAPSYSAVAEALSSKI